MIDQKVLRDALGWACIAAGVMLVGLLLKLNGAALGGAALGIGGALLVLVLAVLAWEFLTKRDDA